MSTADPRLDEALDRIEGTILPSISLMLDTLLDAAGMAEPGMDSAVYAAELRTVALQLEALTRQMEGFAPSRKPQAEYRVAAQDFRVEQRIDIPAGDQHHGALA
jgi:hypothetical protein